MSVCEHEDINKYPNVATQVEIKEGEVLYQEYIGADQTHRYFYSNYNVTTMNQPDKYRKIIINLEPCDGVVYLFVRKTRRCWPNPYSCITLGANGRRQPNECMWTHFMSEIDGSRDGTPTFFEVPLTSTKFFISIYAPQRASYTLTVLADIGAFPRPGGSGRITARQLRELQVQISWQTAHYYPVGISDTNQYWVYSAMLLDSDSRSNAAVFLRPNKIMNTVCGLRNNTFTHYDRVPASACQEGNCSATIDGVITEKRYVFNVVVESQRGFRMAYAGLIMRTDWEEVKPDKTLKVIGAVGGSVLAMVVIIYFLMLKLYG